MKLFLFDLETTDVSENSGIHQISGRIIIEGEVKETFNFHVAPHAGASINPKALEVCGVTLEQIQAYSPMQEVFPQVVAMLDKYIDKYDKKDKFFLVGYNNSHFDNSQFRHWFTLNGFQYFGSYFWSNSLDCMVLATPRLIAQRAAMQDFKQKSVARALGIEVDDTKLHDASYDIGLCHQIYDKVCGLY